jgi:adenine deaminase
MRNVQQKLAIARGEQPAELLFKNAKLVNVLSGEIHPATVAVDDGRVIGVGDYRAKKTIDLKGAYLAPSLIDGHFHVESSMLTAPEFARAVVPHGTGAVVIDPHEYANVLGLDGIRYVLESTKNLPLDFFIMLPSCVPATHLETAGANLTADDLKLMISDERVAGVAELMNFPGVFLGVKSELAKIDAGKGKALTATRPVCAEKISTPTRSPACVPTTNPPSSTRRAKNCGSACTFFCAKAAPSEISSIFCRSSIRKIFKIVLSRPMTSSRAIS